MARNADKAFVLESHPTAYAFQQNNSWHVTVPGTDAAPSIALARGASGQAHAWRKAAEALEPGRRQRLAYERGEQWAVDAEVAKRYGETRPAATPAPVARPSYDELLAMLEKVSRFATIAKPDSTGASCRTIREALHEQVRNLVERAHNATEGSR